MQMLHTNGVLEQVCEFALSVWHVVALAVRRRNDNLYRMTLRNTDIQCRTCSRKLSERLMYAASFSVVPSACAA